ncbi:hypothetical protein QCD60_29495 [Pokkaliibacter sp. MBI-7]|uniref:PFGI-1 class ICE element type IV pilus protein PilL2 n=1 Tax=Pokkaliibacter sp. MBI-7 TaxID=3040600 RepID=UPI00244AE3E5|nr:hypothetical protein [Pokkaliibacter sp. MBI-7]MDH2436652.1 hypothetical protein [Pokkaliibacter sp. MBI-7]
MYTPIRYRYPIIAIALAVLAGCAQQQPKPTPEPVSVSPYLINPDVYAGQVPGVAPSASPSTVTYGRYTQVSVGPNAAQIDLMAQIVDIQIPTSMSPTLGDAVRYVLAKSGYSLAAPSSVTDPLYTAELPAPLYRIESMTLRDALQVLGGPAWQVQVDELHRMVQYVPRPGYAASAEVVDVSAPALATVTVGQVSEAGAVGEMGAASVPSPVRPRRQSGEQ